MATQKATLINSANQKVVVDSGSEQASSYLAKGFQLMGNTGKFEASPAPASPAPNSVADAVKPDAAVNQPAPGASPTPTPSGAPAPSYAPAVTEAPAAKEKVKPEQVEDYTTKPGIAALLASGREFTEEDAKNFAYAKGEGNYQQYVGGVGGATNPNYIGSTNWSKLQKTYTPYQLQQATTRTPNGIYWKPDVNIGDIPSVDPNVSINQDAKKISDIVTKAKDEAKDYSLPEKKEEKKEDETTDTSTASLLKTLQKDYGTSAEDIYNQLFNTDEMKSAQADVTKYKSKIDEYDQQLEDLKEDIRSEVEGEASESYISALATVRGDKILKQKRSAQREYDTALANYNGLKENATNLLSVKSTDANNRYNRLFSMLQLQIQQEGTEFNQELALNQLALQIPEGRSMSIGGSTVTGLKENDNINVVQFTDASGKTYVVGVDKKTGAQTYKTYIGTAKVAGSGGTTDQEVDLDTALYWLSLVKNKDGSYDMESIPANIRKGVVSIISKNKDALGGTKKKSWWERQAEDVTSGDFWSAINPFD